MLINAQHREEMRVAVVDGNTLEHFQLEAAGSGHTRGNIYLGFVTNVQPSLNAAFVNYGAGRDGFLPLKEVVPAAYHRQPKSQKHVRITEVLERGKPLIVQVTKEPEGQKGAALTTYASLAGRYLVFTPFDETRGVSRKVEDDELRAELRDRTSALKVPPGGGFIVRTNAKDQSKTTLAKDFTNLVRAWKRIQADGKKSRETKLLYRDEDLVIRVLRDYLDHDIEELIVDEESAFKAAEEYVKTFLPRTKLKLIRYTEREPLLARYGVERQIERIYDRVVKLPSGASIVIDATEALVAIDVNSGKSTRGANQEETAVNTNIEAANEVARQLRLRDIGGLIVVDFIDMRSAKNRALVEKSLRESMKSDKARFTVGKISPNGLLEINRQRLQQALHLRTQRRCPTCNGTGRIASPEMVSFNLLRRIEERAVAGNLQRVRIALHPELADAFQNQRRQQIAKLEQEFGILVEVIAASHLHRPEQEIDFVEKEAPAKAHEGAAQASAPPAASAVQADAHGENGKRKKRRKRRGRKGDEGHPVVAEAASEPSDAEPEFADEGEPETAFDTAGTDAADEPHENGSSEQRKKRRRRRRRGRGRGEGHGETPGVEGTPVPVVAIDRPVAVTAAAEPEATPPSVHSFEAEFTPSFWTVDRAAVSEDEQRESKRRRSRRSRGGAKTDEADVVAAAAPMPPPEPAERHDVAAAPAEPPHRRNRRRRRRPKGGTAGDQTVRPSDGVSVRPEVPAAPVDFVAPAGEVEASPRKPRRKRTEKVTIDAAADRQAQTDTPRKRTRKASPEAAEGAGETPARRPRRARTNS